MQIAIASALQDALKACSAIERSLIAIGNRVDPERKLELVQCRRRFAEQMGEVGKLLDADPELQRNPEMAMEMSRLLSAFRFAIGQHQASWPAVRIDEDAQAYAASARGTYVKSDQFWNWCNANLKIARP
jgi:hypothetical protein